MSYKRIGDYIHLVDNRNIHLEVSSLLGINITKNFMPSVANTSETDLSKYKIIQKGQFAYSAMQVGRDETIRIALYTKEKPAIISPAYLVIEVNDDIELLPEYIMMWFHKPESDRYGWFISDSSVRASLDWERFCEIQIPVPSIEKQNEIVTEYHIIQNRIQLNQQLIQKLEATAQALYMHWFVDFEFPDENGKPYKSNGGKMVESEMGELPEGWRVGTIDEIGEIIDGDRGVNYPSQEDFSENDYCLFLNAGNVTKNGFDFSNNSFISKEKDNALRKGKLQRNDIVMTTRGTVGNIGYFSNSIPFNDIRINSGMVILRSKENQAVFVFSLLKSEYMMQTIESFLSGSAQPQLPIKDIIRMPIIIPDGNILCKFEETIGSIQNHKDNLNIENVKLNGFANILMAKMTTMN